MSVAEQSADVGCKYWAFISYSHQDNLAVRGDGWCRPRDLTWRTHA